MKQELLSIREQLCSPPVTCGIHAAHLGRFLCCLFWFICHRSVFCSKYCLCLWIFQSWLPLLLSVTFIYHLYYVRVLCVQYYPCLWLIHSWFLSGFVLRLSTVRSMIYTSYIYHSVSCLLLVRAKILVIYIFALMEKNVHLVNFDIYCIVIWSVFLFVCSHLKNWYVE